ncbi:hypothetical protein BK133_20960 [Paenibacillus sp. FSL H8-0548]|nr:hypothetical protein BK133_20960 [Paenibacillus sp. FSL H8-0548]
MPCKHPEDMLPLYDSCPLKGKVEPLIHSQSLHIEDSNVLEPIGSLDRKASSLSGTTFVHCFIRASKRFNTLR